MIGFGFISFFTNFLANKLFKKTQEQVIEESKHDALFTLKMNFSECLQMYYGIFDSLQDTVQRGKYIQGLHNLHTKENGLITPKSATSFVEEVERLLEGLVESNVKVSKDDNDARQRILNLFKDIFDKFFAEALPKE